MKKEKSIEVINFCPSSPRSVTVRGIGAGPHLYPALQACGMAKCVARGLTLPGLLVVVLIIGILAAVAVPQYKLTVDKSRVSTLLPIVDNVRKAQEVYYLANGGYASNISKLDFDIPGNCKMSTEDASIIECPSSEIDNISGRQADPKAWMVTLSYPASNPDLLIIYYFAHHSTAPNKIVCDGRTDYGKKLCQTLAFAN